MKKTVNDMFKYSSENNIKLLSSFNGDFWSEYVSNYNKYDKIFKRLYKSFVYFEQLDDEDIEDVVTNFTEAVEGHLIINAKKYSELYRINSLSNLEYSILHNVDITETMDKDGSKTEGQRQDSDSLGERIDSDSIGQKQNSESIGQKTNSDSIGQREDEESIGRRVDTTDTTIGNQTITNTKEVSPYDSGSFNNESRDTSVSGSRMDGVNNTIGAQENSYTQGAQQNSHTEGAQQNSYTEGSQQNSHTLGAQQNSYIKGSQNDSYSEDYTFTRKGNNGVAAVDLLNKHKKFWDLFEFYSYIFGEIAKEMLLTN